MANKANAGESKNLSYDIDGFTSFLSEKKALSTLLFWKDVEDYTALFGVQERVRTAEKIFERYIKAGAEYEVTCTPAIINDIEGQLDNPPEELFNVLQQEAYNTMLFELFPAFWEAVKTQARSRCTAAPSHRG